MLTQPNSQLRGMLNDLVAAGPPAGRFNGCLVKLFQNDFTPNALTALGDLTEATFTGYAASAAVSWDAAFTDENNSAQIIGDTKQFLQSAPTVTNTVYGYYITDGAGLVLLWAERFAEPKTMDAAGKSITIVPRYTLGRAAA